MGYTVPAPALLPAIVIAASIAVVAVGVGVAVPRVAVCTDNTEPLVQPAVAVQGPDIVRPVQGPDIVRPVPGPDIAPPVPGTAATAHPMVAVVPMTRNPVAVASLRPARVVCQCPAGQSNAWESDTIP
jgi:hypothetical protein